MTIKMGINGFGRIGRNVLRAAVQNFSDIEIVAINDLLEPEYLAYMLQYDSVHGRFKGTIAVDGNTLIVNGRNIRLTQERDPANLKWSAVGADVVLECTGLFLTKETGQKHIDAGARKVILSAPSKDDTPMFVFGVNDKSYAGQAVISNASCTTNCLAPVAKVLHDNWGIKRGLMTTGHAATATQKTVDSPSNNHWRARPVLLDTITPPPPGPAWPTRRGPSPPWTAFTTASPEGVQGRGSRDAKPGPSAKSVPARPASAPERTKARSL